MYELIIIFLSSIQLKLKKYLEKKLYEYLISYKQFVFKKIPETWLNSLFKRVNRKKEINFAFHFEINELSLYV